MAPSGFISRVLYRRKNRRQRPFIWDDDCSAPHATYPDVDSETSRLVADNLAITSPASCLV